MLKEVIFKGLKGSLKYSDRMQGWKVHERENTGRTLWSAVRVYVVIAFLCLW